MQLCVFYVGICVVMIKNMFSVDGVHINNVITNGNY